MRNLLRSRVISSGNVIWHKILFSFFLSAVALSATPLSAEQCNAVRPLKENITQKIQKLQAPFIANIGQIDERVRFYAQTFRGTVFVTEDGEIVYSLPEVGAGNDGGEQRGNGAEWHGRVSLVRVASGFAANGWLPFFRTGSANCPPVRVLAKSLLAAYLPEIPNPQSIMRGVALKEQLVGGNISEIKGGAKSMAIVSCFTGNDPSKWQSNISTYEIVDMGEVYEGIDLRLKACGNNVEKLFTVRPSANHEIIRIKLAGAQKLTVNESGELVAETELGAVKFTRPVAFQEIDGTRVEVAAEYSIYVSENDGMESRGTWVQESGGEPETQNAKPETRNSKPETQNPKLIYGFTVASYDKTKDLIIDPLLASTYLGGVFEDHGKAIAVDADGNVYVTGETLSSDFPTTPGAYVMSRSGNTEVFVSKFNSGLTNLLASTFLGGSLNHDRGCSIAIDAGGNVFVAGTTYSTDFPTTRGSYDTASNGRWDVFVSKFNNGLTNLLASTFLGKSSDEYGYSIAIDAGGNVYVTGETLSFDFPTTPGAYDTSYNGGYYDAFVSKFNNGLTSLLASTFLGGGAGDYGRAIAVDGVGNTFVTGNTCSKDFPATPDVYDAANNGGNDDAFVSKLNSGLTSLLASTYLGGYSNDCGKAIAVDGGGNVYVTGDTVSPNFPTTAGAYATLYNRGSKDVFISKFDNGLASLSASTFLGGHANDYGKAIAIDAGGYVYVAGSTSSKDFPTTPGAYDTSSNGDSDVFVSMFNSGLANLLLSTLQGGSRSDFGNSMTVGPGGYVYVIGETLSLDFPTTPGAYDTSYHRCEDIFVSRFNVELSVDKAGK
ncbi:MAG: hypothetical protein HW390_3080 [Candidatus Brocadiaceae bacterium]|nr:hypothetical protein [Candidatus Brocadiaceae bacterium]